MKRLKVAILGATGVVGQHYIKLLANHPWFKITALTGSTSVGRRYVEAVRGEGPDPPKEIAEMEVLPTDPKHVDADFVFSCLPTEAAGELEPRFAEAGFPVVSDASAHRMEHDVPLIIPEVNPQHLNMVERQRKNRKWDGFIVTTPNCTTVGLVLALYPLYRSYGVRRLYVTTMQAISGAGFPGVPALSITSNVIPYISKEEEKVEQETMKLLGEYADGGVKPASFMVEVTCTRVPTVDGHLEALHIETEENIDVEEAKRVLADFTSLPQELNLPTAPRRPVIVREEPDRPQPRVDVNAGSVPGMSVVVGRVRQGKLRNSVNLLVLSHNLIRGAAGGAVLTAELAHHMKLLRG